MHEQDLKERFSIPNMLAQAYGVQAGGSIKGETKISQGTRTRRLKKSKAGEAARKQQMRAIKIRRQNRQKARITSGK
jgi:hypothetical protein